MLILKCSLEEKNQKDKMQSEGKAEEKPTIIMIDDSVDPRETKKTICSPQIMNFLERNFT